MKKLKHQNFTTQKFPGLYGITCMLYTLAPVPHHMPVFEAARA